jgi:hypothetical protein
MKLIRSEHNTAIVNLDKVTYIHPAKSKAGGKHVIYFVFDCMNSEVVNEIKWEFNDESYFDFVMGKLNIDDV